MIKKIDYLIKHNVFVQKAYVVFMSALFRLLSLIFRPDNHQIMFQSMSGKNYGDSPRVLFERMKEEHAFDSSKYIWAFVHPEKFKTEGAEMVKLNSLRYFIQTMKSGIWITNVDMEFGLHYKSKKQIYINTYHGVPMKYIGNAQKNRNDYNYYDVDLMCCSGEFDREIFIRDFHVPQNVIIQCGMPRNDELYSVSKSDIEKYRKEFNIPTGKKVILYCPTWRDSGDTDGKSQIAPPIDVDYWERELGNEYVMLFRMHHLTTEMLGITYNEFARDVSSEQQINKLLIIADILISDYSATVFDYCILERPIVSFAYDYEEYSNSRGFYEKAQDILPDRFFSSQEEIVKHIQTMDYNRECDRTRKVKQKYMQADGHATDVCIEYIIKHMKKQKNGK